MINRFFTFIGLKVKIKVIDKMRFTYSLPVFADHLEENSMGGYIDKYHYEYIWRWQSK